MRSRLAFACAAVAALASAAALAKPLRGTLVVANRGDHSVTFVDLTDNNTGATFKTAIGPHEAAVSPDGTLAAIAEYGAAIGGNTIRLFSVSRREEIARLDLREFNRPHGMAFTPDNARLIVTCETRERVLVVDLDSQRVVADIPTGAKGSHMLALSPKGDRAYTTNVASNSVSVVDLEKKELLGVIETANAPEAIALSPDGKHLWIGGRADNVLQIIDTESRTIVDTIDCPGMPFRLAFTPDGKRVVATCAVEGVVRVFDAAKRAEEGVVHLEFHGEWADRVDDTPPGMADIVPLGVIAPSDDFAFVTVANGAMAVEIDLNTRAITRRFETGAGPDGIAFSARVGVER